MMRCPTCGSFYRQPTTHCLRDKTALEDSDGVIERYQIEDRLGEGGMGVVYRAKHTMLDDHWVAIKMLHQQLSQNAEVVNRFFREAKAASQVKNEHIVDVIDFGMTGGGDSFLVMEFLDGENLRDVVDDKGAMPIEKALTIAVQIAEGLYQVHKKGIIHRDLKPENVVLISREGKDFVKLLDFGIAKLTELQDTHLTRAGMIVGTPAYMSPEQAGGEQVDLRTDIYALGTMLYEMLTGRLPFEATTTKKMLLCQLTQEPTPPRVFREEIPFSVETVILHALSKEREERPQNMLHLAYALRDAMAGRDPTLPGKKPSSDEETDAAVELFDEVAVTSGTSPVRRMLPFIGMGAGLLIGVLVTVLLMRSDEKPRPVAKTVAAAPAAAPDAAPPAPKVVIRDRTPDAAAPARKKTRHQTRPRPRRPRVPSIKTRPPEKKAPVSEPRGKYMAQVKSVPPRAEVYQGGKMLGRTPLKVDTGAASTVTIHKSGFSSGSVKLPARSTRTFTVKLTKSTMSWEVLSLSQLKKMMKDGQISRFTYGRRKAQLIKTRDKKLVKLRVKLKMGHLTEDQYKRMVQAVNESYK